MRRFLGGALIVLTPFIALAVMAVVMHVAFVPLYRAGYLPYGVYVGIGHAVSLGLYAALLYKGLKLVED